MSQLLLIMVLGLARASQQSLVQDDLRAQGLRPQEDSRAGWGEASREPGNSWNSPDAWRKEQQVTGKREEEAEKRSAEGRSLGGCGLYGGGLGGGYAQQLYAIQLLAIQLLQSCQALGGLGGGVGGLGGIGGLGGLGGGLWRSEQAE